MFKLGGVILRHEVFDILANDVDLEHRQCIEVARLLVADWWPLENETKFTFNL